MAKILVCYETTLYYEEEIDVPDVFVNFGKSDVLTDDGWDYVRERVSYHDEIDCDTNFIDAAIVVKPNV